MGGTQSTPSSPETQIDNVTIEDEILVRKRENVSYSIQPDIISSSRVNTEKTVPVFSDSDNSDEEFEDALDDLNPLPGKVSLTDFQQLQTSILGRLVTEVEELLVHLSNQTDSISSEQCQVLLSSVNAVTQAYSAVATPKSSPSKLTNGSGELSQAKEESTHARIPINQKRNSEDSESGVDTTFIHGNSAERKHSPFGEHEILGRNTQDAEGGGTTGRSNSSSSCNTAWEIDLTNWGSENTEKRKKLATKPILKKHNTDSESKDISSEVQSGIDEMSRRKVLDLKRWYCMSRPQIKRSCGVSSLVSCWNYLFSSLGHGNLPPLIQEQALTILGFQQPFNEIEFGTSTGNKTLMRWFRRINDHFGVKGRTYFLYKPQGRNKTCGITSDLALDSLKHGLQDNHTTFIYHCQNHYFCPIGFEDTSLNPDHAYCPVPSDSDVECWVLIGDTSKAHPGIHFKRWSDVLIDLNCRSPEYFDIRQTDKGKQTRKSKKVGGNLHCIITFQKFRTVDAHTSRSRSRSKSSSSDGSPGTGSSENYSQQENTNITHSNMDSVTYFGDHTDSDVIETDSD